jgi:hypothetical protein
VVSGLQSQVSMNLSILAQNIQSVSFILPWVTLKYQLCDLWYSACSEVVNIHAIERIWIWIFNCVILFSLRLSGEWNGICCGCSAQHFTLMVMLKTYISSTSFVLYLFHLCIHHPSYSYFILCISSIGSISCKFRISCSSISSIFWIS